MSLAVDGERRRGHARSRSRDGRPADDQPTRGVPVYGDVREPSYVYPEDDLDDPRYQSSRRREPSHGGSGLPYPTNGDMGGLLPESHPSYSYDDPRPVYKTVSPTPDSAYRSSREHFDSQPPGAFPEDVPVRRGDASDPRRSRYAEPLDAAKHKGRGDRPEEDRPVVRHAEPSRDKYGLKEEDADDKLKFLPQKYSRRYEDDADDKRSREKAAKKERRAAKKERDEDDLAYGNAPPPPRSPRPDSPPTYGSYIPASRADARPSRYDYDDGRDARPSKHDVDGGRDRRSSKYDVKDDRDVRSSKYDPDGGRDRRSSKYDDKHDDGGGKRSSKYDDRRDDDDRRRPRPASPPGDDYGRRSHRDSHRDDPRSSAPSVLTVEPGSRDRERSRERRRDKSPGPAQLAIEAPPAADRRRDKSPGPSVLTVEPGSRERDRSRDRRGSERDRSPQPPTARMSSLSVGNAARVSAMSLAAAPGSPLLESYHGTYQDMSPMPSPLLLASQHPKEDPRIVDALSSLNSDGEGESRKLSRRARFHDPEDIATQLARALKGNEPPDVQPLVAILPSLTHEQVMELRVDYKKIAKTGSERKGINIAKHIRARLKDEDPNLMKACYSVALGMWESEAYWANFWYQGDKTRRELLIESLMGRTNSEIREIKEGFTDKKYDNSLTKCMKTELKEDKFKKAVLLVLDERRMEDYDHYGRRVPIDYDLVDKDVSDLRKAVKAEKGGESLMISIVVQRSDDHLREVLKEYEHHYRVNFAREALKKSGNLVGELLAHILNGVINRPVRDALLLHHALTLSRKDHLRRELLISRLVRFHWDAVHMLAVKRAYHERYGRDLQDAVREATSGQLGLFLSELCIARMPNDVRKLY